MFCHPGNGMVDHLGGPVKEAPVVFGWQGFFFLKNDRWPPPVSWQGHTYCQSEWRGSSLASTFRPFLIPSMFEKGSTPVKSRMLSWDSL